MLRRGLAVAWVCLVVIGCSKSGTRASVVSTNAGDLQSFCQLMLSAPPTDAFRHPQDEDARAALDRHIEAAQAVAPAEIRATVVAYRSAVQAYLRSLASGGMDTNAQSTQATTADAINDFTDRHCADVPGTSMPSPPTLPPNLSWDSTLTGTVRGIRWTMWTARAANGDLCEAIETGDQPLGSPPDSTAFVHGALAACHATPPPGDVRFEGGAAIAGAWLEWGFAPTGSTFTGGTMLDAAQLSDGLFVVPVEDAPGELRVTTPTTSLLCKRADLPMSWDCG